ncbi:unnamed protein product, partial [Didymodactylos carnosus]
LGDLFHIAAVSLLLFRILKRCSSAGISGKSIILYAIVFTCRYLDLFTHYVSLYNTLLKWFFLITTYFTMFLIYCHGYSDSKTNNNDTFRIVYLIVPTAILAFVWNSGPLITEVRL